MKSCLTCKRIFEDTLTYCLVDGALLSAPFEPHATRLISHQNPTVSMTNPMTNPKSKPNQIPWIIGTGVTLLIVATIVVFTLVNRSITSGEPASNATQQNKDEQVKSVINDINSFTDELVKKIDSAADPSSGVDEAQKYMDSRKSEIRDRWNSIKNIGEKEVSEETKKKMQDDLFNDGKKLGEEIARHSADSAVNDKLRKLVQEFQDIFKMQDD